MHPFVLNQVKKSGSGWEPVSAEDNISVMSVGFMLGNKTDAVIWRGPRKTGMRLTPIFCVDVDCLALIKQFLTDVNWGTLDFLIVDGTLRFIRIAFCLPCAFWFFLAILSLFFVLAQRLLGPATSIYQLLNILPHAQKLMGRLLLPLRRRFDCKSIRFYALIRCDKKVSLLDVRKEISFCKKVGIPVIGVVENMAGFVCPCCKVFSYIFYDVQISPLLCLLCFR